MSDDNKISGRVIATARVLGLLNTAIERVDGVNVNATAFSTGLLDTYGSATVAYSVRRLSSTYTGPCMRVREDGTNTEIDIGFNSAGHVDVLAIRDHCGSNNGFIRYLYDQSGNANDAGQATATSQTKIYDGSRVITANGKPAITATALQHFDVSSPPTFTDFTFTIVSKKTSETTGIIAYDNGSGYLFPARSTGSPYMQAFVSPGADTLFANSLSNTSLVGTEEYNQILSYGYRSGTSADAGMNGEVNTTATVGTDSFTLRTLLDYGGNTSFSFAGEVQEIIFWNSSKNSDRSGIESNINAYFNIY